MNNNFEKYLGIANHDIQIANTSQELKSYVASILYENDKKVEEINRLNNIINELEKDLNEAYDELHRGELVNGRELINNIYQELKKLKDSD